VRQELSGFDPSDRVLDQVAELFALFVADGCPEILNLDQSFADKYHLSDVCDPGDPGIANQLRIQGQQSGRRLFFLQSLDHEEERALGISYTR
jgi:hypothetical protein